MKWGAATKLVEAAFLVCHGKVLRDARVEMGTNVVILLPIKKKEKRHEKKVSTNLD